jgi:DNA topoisomerase-2
LGTSTSAEAKEYFIDINTKVINYFWENVDKEIKDKFSESLSETKSKKSKKNVKSESEEEISDDNIFINRDDDDAIRLAFDKTRADDRKKWLMNYDKNRVLDYKQKIIPYYDFIHYDLIHFSNEDLIRSIPSVVDGLKPSQRKILYGAFLRGLDKEEVKVAQLAGFVSDRAAYHHGEMSLNGAIIGMAQNFVGSNNINLLKPVGQFGTRLKAGKDAASPRYIWTMLEDLTTTIYNPIDDNILNQQTDDGIPIEPEFYAPIIPMVLVNGTEGIGTGFSTKIPPFNPIDIINNLKNIINDKKYQEMIPWWQGFKGEVKCIDSNNFEINGNYTINSNTLSITELPVGEWTSNYKDFLEKNLEDAPKKPDPKKKVVKKENPFIGYKDNNTDEIVNFELTFEDGYLENTHDIDKLYHLSKKYSITNMHLYGPEGHIKKYDNVEDIIKDYYKVRLDLYQKRKDSILNILEHQLKLISYKVKFILMIVEKKLNINNMKKQDIETKLEELKFPKLSKDKKQDDKETYDYLLTMPIYNLTKEKIDELKNIENEKQVEYDLLENKTIKEIWLEELELLETKYDKWYKNNHNVVSKKKLKNKK